MEVDMKFRSSLAAGAAITAVLATAATAYAAAPFDQVNGNGKTHADATLGFNAKSDLSGELQYRSADGAFSAHCQGYTSWRLEQSPDGLPKPRVTATCTDQDGTTVYLKAKFVDRAEPGAHKDVARIWWSYTDPNASHAPFIRDVGAIQDGNLQYHAGA
jgi:hypothetical protein